MLNKIDFLPAVLAAGMSVAMIGCTAADNEDNNAVEDAADATGEYIDDNAITTMVKTALFSENDLSGYDLGVETESGAVQLSGFIGSQNESDRASRIARGIEGVKSVDNAISVR